MKTLKFLNDSFILCGAFLIAFTFALSALNVSFANHVMDFIVGGKTYGVQFDSNGAVTDLDEPVQLSVEESTTGWGTNIQPAARAYYSQPTVSTAYVQWGQR